MSKITRRDFVKQSALASTSLLVPSFVQSSTEKAHEKAGKEEKALVIVQWSGGNDGLNTLVPFRNDAYYKNRPTLAVKAADVLRLTGSDDLGFNPVMKGMRELYDDGYVSVINNVGYPDPDRSHFRSMDIWHTASDASKNWTTGWLGRYLEHYPCSDCSIQALEVDDTLSLALKGKAGKGFAANDINKLIRATQSPLHKSLAERYQRADHEHEEDNIAYLYKTLINTRNSAQYLEAQLANIKALYKSSVAYPNTAFGKDMNQIAQLIISGSGIKVYYANIGGFDTHVRQKATQERLLETYSEAMRAFVADMKANNRINDVLVMTFSEFGRRVAQNGSFGTDHGTANNLYLIGGGLKKKGIFNGLPNLTNLDQGDLKYEIDFRRIYATILEKWLQVDAAKVLEQKFEVLPVI